MLAVEVPRCATCIAPLKSRFLFPPINETPAALVKSPPEVVTALTAEEEAF
jgi:hypothetical protein